VRIFLRDDGASCWRFWSRRKDAPSKYIEDIWMAGEQAVLSTTPGLTGSQSAVPALGSNHCGCVAAAVSFVLVSFGSAIGLAVASPSPRWRDTSSELALLGGLWLLLTSLAAFGLGGYLAGRLRETWSDSTPDVVEFRDGIHGVLVWGLAIIIGAFLALATTRAIPGQADLKAPTAASAEPLLAFELDRLFRSDRNPAEPGNDPELPGGEDHHRWPWALGDDGGRPLVPRSDG
jgi:hypothetical protein